MLTTHNQIWRAKRSMLMSTPIIDFGLDLRSHHRVQSSSPGELVKNDNTDMSTISRRVKKQVPTCICIQIWECFVIVHKETSSTKRVAWRATFYAPAPDLPRRSGIHGRQ